MEELVSHSDFENFCILYLGMAYVGYHLEEYTVKGIKKIHGTISGKSEGFSKCTSECSKQFGRDSHKWCALCQNWQIRLTEYLHSDKVAWERMESWKWPDSYTNIIEVFVPTICSVYTPYLQDFYVQSYIWANCTAFKINPRTIKGLRDVRNAIVHNSTICVSSTQMEKCFGVLQKLLSDPGVVAYFDPSECKERMNILHYIQNLKNAGQAKRVLLDVLLTANQQYETDTKEQDSKQRKGIYEKFENHQNIINRMCMYIIRKYFLVKPLIKGILLCLIMVVLLLVRAVFTLTAEDLRRPFIHMVCVIVSVPILLVILATRPNNRFLPRQGLYDEPIGYTIIDRLLSPLDALARKSVSSNREHNRLNLFKKFQMPEPKYSTQGQLSESKYSKKDGIHAETRKGEWDCYLNSEDVALLSDMIHQGFLPDSEQLDRTCAVLSQSSMIIDLVTDTICKAIQQKYTDKVRRVWAAYEPKRENHIVFVIITNGKEANADIEFKPDYDLRFRQDGDFNSESKEVILEENAQDLFPEGYDIFKVQTCIKESTSTLMKKHSNLTLISASLLKCKAYGTDICKKERKPCIVLHVHIKGLIPLRESLFPTQLKGVNTDVREGCMLLNTGKGPHDNHPNVKMGCGIKAKDQDAHGTLGGFIQHPKYGLCALTCAHAMIDDIKRLQNKRTKFENGHVECVQPCFERHDPGGSRFGILKLTVLQERIAEGLVTLDYALIAVDKDRAPIDGSFPSAKLKELNDAGFRSPPSFKTGEVIDYTTLAGRGTSFVKYGSTTLLTCGTIKWLNQTISFKDQSSGIVFQNQIQINLTKTPGKNSFSAGGDSGALIFKVDDNERLTAVGLLVAGNEKIGISVATPICDILADIGVQRLKDFTDSVVNENESANQYRDSTLKKCCCKFCRKIRTFFFGNRGKRGKQN